MCEDYYEDDYWSCSEREFRRKYVERKLSILNASLFYIKEFFNFITSRFKS